MHKYAWVKEMLWTVVVLNVETMEEPEWPLILWFFAQFCCLGAARCTQITTNPVFMDTYRSRSSSVCKCNHEIIFLKYTYHLIHIYYILLFFFFHSIFTIRSAHSAGDEAMKCKHCRISFSYCFAYDNDGKCVCGNETKQKSEFGRTVKCETKKLKEFGFEHVSG